MKMLLWITFTVPYVVNHWKNYGFFGAGGYASAYGDVIYEQNPDFVLLSLLLRQWYTLTQNILDFFEMNDWNEN